ncbi:MAG: methyltransferase, TIGR04325 family [Bacteroidales bacterium]
MKSVAKDWLPPVVVRAIRQLRGEGIRFEGEFASWGDASARCTGYDAGHILSKVLDATLKVKSGEAAFERDSVLFDEIEYSWPITAGLMWAAACGGGRLNVLDFGGALGSSYFQNRKLLSTLSSVRWNVVEQSHYVQAGKVHVQDEQLRFYLSIDECLGENQPNVVLFSGVLQYLSDPFLSIKKVLKSNIGLIILDRTIVNPSSLNNIYVQHVPASIYPASYPCWSLSEGALVSLLSSKYKIESSFPSLKFSELDKIGSEFKGFIFSKIKS